MSVFDPAVFFADCGSEVCMESVAGKGKESAGANEKMEHQYFTLDGQISVGFLKKRNFTGSYKGMRYNMFVKDNQIVAATYPQPYCWECTPEEQKTTRSFELSQEGLDAAIAWLNESWGDFSWQE